MRVLCCGTMLSSRRQRFAEQRGVGSHLSGNIYPLSGRGAAAQLNRHRLEGDFTNWISFLRFPVVQAIVMLLLWEDNTARFLRKHLKQRETGLICSTTGKCTNRIAKAAPFRRVPLNWLLSSGSSKRSPFPVLAGCFCDCLSPWLHMGEVVTRCCLLSSNSSCLKRKLTSTSRFLHITKPKNYQAEEVKSVKFPCLLDTYVSLHYFHVIINRRDDFRKYIKHPRSLQS